MVEPVQTNEFDAAKQIAEILKAVDKAKHQQVLRWASESVGATLPIPIAQIQSVTALAGLEQTLPNSTQTPAGANPSDIRTFIGQKNPKSDVHFAAAVAYFYRFVAVATDRVEAITADVLQDSGRKSGRGVFKNPRIPLDNAVKQGYLDRDGKGLFKLNAVGENLVAMTLPGALEPQVRKSPPKSKGPKRAPKK